MVLYDCSVLTISEFSLLEEISVAEPQSLQVPVELCRECCPIPSPHFLGTWYRVLPWGLHRKRRLLWRIWFPADGSHPLHSHTSSGLTPFPHSQWPCHHPLCTNCHHAAVRALWVTNSAEKIFLFRNFYWTRNQKRLINNTCNCFYVGFKCLLLDSRKSQIYNCMYKLNSLSLNMLYAMAFYCTDPVLFCSTSAWFSTRTNADKSRSNVALSTVALPNCWVVYFGPLNT